MSACNRSMRETTQYQWKNLLSCVIDNLIVFYQRVVFYLLSPGKPFSYGQVKHS